MAGASKSSLIAGCIAALWSAAPAAADLLHFSVSLSGGEQVPANGSPGTGSGSVSLDTVTNEFSWSFSYSGLVSNVSLVAFHGPALPGFNAGIRINLGTAPSPVTGSQIIAAAQAGDVAAGLWYLNVHTTTFPGGEIRGQLNPSGGESFEIDWHTIDGGGTMDCEGGGFELAGTIGQWDAGPASTGAMTGGGFELVGGFWGVTTPSSPCACLADVTGDELINGADVQAFVDCAVASGSNCGCADVAAPSGSIDLADVAAFAGLLLGGEGCE
ncbi:MAG TPA: CHRD domain-containing protein [Phycisphaerae bacterium]|nr:CHRD domain-containing protein [Phycisphaerae bacterium]